MTQSLSPAAQVIWDDYNAAFDDAGVFTDYGDALAAALRALADQLAYGHGSSVKKSAIIDEDEVRAIATELENHQ